MATPTYTLTKIPSSTFVTPGDTITYTFVFTTTNAGGLDPVNFSDMITPTPGITLTTISLTANPPGTFKNNIDDPLNPTIDGTLPAPQTQVTFTLVQQVSATSSPGTISDTAQVTTIEGKTIVTLATASATVIVLAGITPMTDLAVLKSGATKLCKSHLQKPFTYEIAAVNNGPADATNVLLTDILPDFINRVISFRQLSGPTFILFTTPCLVTATIPLFPAGSVAIFELIVELCPKRIKCDFSNQVTITSSTPDPILYNNIATATTRVIPSV